MEIIVELEPVAGLGNMELFTTVLHANLSGSVTVSQSFVNMVQRMLFPSSKG